MTENLKERLDLMQADIEKVKTGVAINLTQIQSVEYFIKRTDVRSGLTDNVKSIRLELLRLNNALQQIKNIRLLLDMAQDRDK